MKEGRGGRAGKQGYVYEYFVWVGGWPKLRMIGDRSIELVQSVIDLRVLLFVLFPFHIGYACAC